jgi:predicted HicB family RNase H-like nuclease
LLVSFEAVDDSLTDPKQQFNVYLPVSLIRRAKHAAVDEAVSLSRLVQDALTAHLDTLEAERSG